MDHFLIELLLKMAIVFFCVSWINTLFIHYWYLKNEGTIFTKENVKGAYMSSLICTVMTIFVVRMYEVLSQVIN